MIRFIVLIAVLALLTPASAQVQQWHGPQQPPQATVPQAPAPQPQVQPQWPQSPQWGGHPDWRPGPPFHHSWGAPGWGGGWGPPHVPHYGPPPVYAPGYVPGGRWWRGQYYAPGVGPCWNFVVGVGYTWSNCPDY